MADGFRQFISRSEVLELIELVDILLFDPNERPVGLLP
jgi:hypothetical protein